MRRTEKKIYNASEVYRIRGSCFPELDVLAQVRLRSGSDRADSKINSKSTAEKTKESYVVNPLFKLSF
jgi:hypothetical protein